MKNKVDELTPVDVLLNAGPDVLSKLTVGQIKALDEYFLNFKFRQLVRIYSHMKRKNSLANFTKVLNTWMSDEDSSYALAATIFVLLISRQYTRQEESGS